MTARWGPSGMLVGNSFQAVAFSMSNYESESVRNHRGDKIVISDGIFRNIINVLGSDDMPSPLCFQIKSLKNPDMICHCGVLEFSSSAEEIAYIPSSILENLDIDEGDQVELRLRKLPPAQKLVLKALTASWAKVTDPQGGLRVALQSFTVLTEGDVITLPVAGKDYKFYVSSVEAEAGSGTASCSRRLRYSGEEGYHVDLARACCVVDVDLRVEFAEALVQAPESVAVALDDTIIAGVDATPLWEGSLSSGQTRHLHLRTPPRISGMGLVLRLLVEAGEVDLFAGYSAHPTAASARWVLMSPPMGTGVPRPPQPLLTLAPTDDGFRFDSMLHMTLYAPPALDYAALAANAPTLTPGSSGYSGGANADASSSSSSSSSVSTAIFKVFAQRVPADSTAALSVDNTGAVLSHNTLSHASAAAAAAAAPADSESPGPGHELCRHCHEWVPSASFRMHDLRCARMAQRCAVCHRMVERRVAAEHVHCAHCPAVCHPAWLYKHQLVAHQRYPCDDCGQPVAALSADTHAQVCANRGVVCRFCDATVASAALTAHIDRCGNMMRPCKYCDKMHPTRFHSNHYATEHGFNPSFPLPDPTQWRIDHGMASPHLADAPVQDSTDPALDAMVSEQLASMGIDPTHDPEVAAAIRASLIEAMAPAPAAAIANDEAGARAAAAEVEDHRFVEDSAFSCPICQRRMDAWELDEHLDTCGADQ